MSPHFAEMVDYCFRRIVDHLMDQRKIIRRINIASYKYDTRYFGPRSHGRVRKHGHQVCSCSSCRVFCPINVDVCTNLAGERRQRAVHQRSFALARARPSCSAAFDIPMPASLKSKSGE